MNIATSEQRRKRYWCSSHLDVVHNSLLRIPCIYEIATSIASACGTLKIVQAAVKSCWPLHGM